MLLVAPKWNEKVYPYDDLLLHNTAQIDPEKLDFVTFPKANNLELVECLLRAGNCFRKSTTS